MFSGIIKSTGVLQSIKPMGSSMRMDISSSLSDEVTIDQSLSHDGICLTIVEVNNGSYTVDVVEETLSKTTFKHLRTGHLINLEKSITPTTLLDGHLVQGHVDTVLECLHINDKHGSWNMKLNLPKEFAALIIPRGSVCLNGVSLTVSNLFNDSFEVAIIPYTYDHTNFHLLREGNLVNVEFDLVGKYLLRQAELNLLR